MNHLASNLEIDNRQRTAQSDGNNLQVQLNGKITDSDVREAISVQHND